MTPGPGAGRAPATACRLALYPRLGRPSSLRRILSGTLAASAPTSSKADALIESRRVPSKVLSSFAIAGVLLALAGCSGSPSTESSTETEASDGCTPAASGAASDAVQVEGDLGTAPTVTIDAPLESPEETERTVVIEGEGDPAESGSVVTVQYSAFNGTSGESIEATTYAEDGSADFELAEGLLPGLLTALECSTAGERITAVIPPADAFGDTGSEALGLAAADSLVFVLDVVKIAEPVEAPEALPRANGADQPIPDGFPAVTLGDDGAPTVTIPDAAAPTKLQIAVLKQGDGATVEDGADVTVHYTGVIWETGEVFDSSWTRGAPATFSTNGVIPGFSQALVGQQVGSQVIAVIPPAQGYGDTPPEGSTITATSTLVFVVDILATQ